MALILKGAIVELLGASEASVLAIYSLARVLSVALGEPEQVYAGRYVAYCRCFEI